MVPYNGLYFYPPRTEIAIPFSDNPVLRMWRGFSDAVGQYKLNGTRNVVKVSPDGKLEFWNRHRERQKYTIPNTIRDYFLDISPKGYWTVWDTELMHTKTVHVKNLISVFDCLVWESQYLVGVPYRDRYKICTDNVKKLLKLPLPANAEAVYLSECFQPSQWEDAWKEVKSVPYQAPVLEGLVLKRLNLPLEYSSAQINNSGFMCRVRIKNKNYMY